VVAGTPRKETATVTRAQRSDRRRIVPGAVAAGIAGLAAALAVAGCGAGQQTQTDSVEPAVNGAMGQVGPIAVRNALLAFPEGAAYLSGGSAPLVVTIVNTGSSDDQLVEVSSPVADSVQLAGDRSLPARRSIQVGTPGMTASRSTSSVATTTRTPTSSPPPPSSPPPASSSSAASSSLSPVTSATVPVEIGKATIVLNGLKSTLEIGKTYPVTFVFARAGSVTLQLPIANPSTSRSASTSASSSG
jgi:copper(I)-binding protein